MITLTDNASLRQPACTLLYRNKRGILRPCRTKPLVSGRVRLQAIA